LEIRLIVVQKEEITLKNFNELQERNVRNRLSAILYSVLITFAHLQSNWGRIVKIITIAQSALTAKMRILFQHALKPRKLVNPALHLTFTNRPQSVDLNLTA